MYGVTCVLPTGLQLCKSSIQHGDNGSSTTIMAVTVVQVIHPQSSGLLRCHIHEKISKAQQAQNMKEHKNHMESVHINIVMAQSTNINAQLDWFHDEVMVCDRRSGTHHIHMWRTGSVAQQAHTTVHVAKQLQSGHDISFDMCLDISGSILAIHIYMCYTLKISYILKCTTNKAIHGHIKIVHYYHNFRGYNNR